MRNRKHGRSVVLEKESLEVGFEGIQEGFLLERKGKIPCTGAEDGKVCLEERKKCWLSVRSSRLLTRFQFPSASREFFPQSAFSADSLTLFLPPPCTIACVNICVHVKIPNIDSHPIVWTHTNTATPKGQSSKDGMCLHR